MTTTTLNPIENVTESAKAAFYKLVDICYGTRKRSNITISTVILSVIAIKLVETYAVVPYCAV